MEQAWDLERLFVDKYSSIKAKEQRYGFIPLRSPFAKGGSEDACVIWSPEPLAVRGEFMSCHFLLVCWMCCGCWLMLNWVWCLVRKDWTRLVRLWYSRNLWTMIVWHLRGLSYATCDLPGRNVYVGYGCEAMSRTYACICCYAWDWEGCERLW